ncbi:MAG: hypothetical protein P1U32_01535 [Legionellaceae bacterium]|nr:hypothetical protein [Legionellaceae bacterium]
MAKKTDATQASPEWLSTYGILTAERILERFSIRLSHEELISTLKDRESRYYHLLSMPLKNIFNGILINQVHDYQVYIQKTLIDYKLTTTGGLENEDETQQGTNAEEEIRIKQGELITLGETFEEKKYAHRQLISDSQRWLIYEAPKENSLSNSPDLAGFNERAEELLFAFKNLRAAFRTLILDVTALLQVMPDYHLDEEKMAQNQEALGFNADLDEILSSDEG